MSTLTTARLAAFHLRPSEGTALVAGMGAGALTGVLASGLPADVRLAVLLLPFAVAAAIDLRTRRIPNWLAAGALALALAEAVVSGRTLESGAGALAALAAGLGLLLLARGSFGMGDVKLITAAGAAVGIAWVPSFLLAMSLAGGLVAVVLLSVSRRRGLTMPYGPAIAAGVGVVLLVAARGP